MTDRKILEERARQLAAPLAELTALGVGEETLVFRRGSERFGISLDAVVEVQRGPAMTPLPTASAPIVGVIAWRGRILTVIDIGGSGGRLAADGDWRAVIVGRARARVAIIADAVDETRAVLPDELRAIDDVAPALESGRVPLTGIASDALIVIDGEALLARYSS